MILAPWEVKGIYLDYWSRSTGPAKPQLSPSLTVLADGRAHRLVQAPLPAWLCHLEESHGVGISLQGRCMQEGEVVGISTAGAWGWVVTL